MTTNRGAPQSYATPELRAAALALVRTTMEEKRQDSGTVARSLGIPAAVLKLAIAEDDRDFAAQLEARTVQILALTQVGRSSQQVARTLKLAKWEVESCIENAHAREREAVRTAEMDSPDFRQRALALLKAGRTATQVARTLKAPKTRIDAIAWQAEIDAAQLPPPPPQVSASISIPEHSPQSASFRLGTVSSQAALENKVPNTLQGAAHEQVWHADAAPRVQSCNCPNCGSTDWKLLQHVFNEGLQSLHTSSTSTGVGINTSGSIGVGRATTTTVGIQQSELSRMATPPTAPHSGLHYLTSAVVMGVIASLLLYAGYTGSSSLAMWIGGGCTLFAALTLGASLQAPAEQERYEKQFDEWQRTKMCTRCGHYYF